MTKLIREARSLPVTMKAMVYDATGPDSRHKPLRRFFGIERTWPLGASVFRGEFNVVAAVHSWAGVYDLIQTLAKIGRVELHIWGHGEEGRPLIGGEAPNLDEESWREVWRVWFRSCLVFRDVEGVAFAEELADKGVSCVGHTSIIGALAHSYTYGLRAHRTPYWKSDRARGPSRPWYPRSTGWWNHEIPEWVFIERDHPGSSAPLIPAVVG